MTWMKISDRRSVGLWYIKGTNKSTLFRDLLVPDCPKGMHLNSEGAHNLAEYRERVKKGTERINSLPLLSSLLSYATLLAKLLLTNPA